MAAFAGFVNVDDIHALLVSPPAGLFADFVCDAVVDQGGDVFRSFIAFFVLVRRIPMKVVCAVGVKDELAVGREMPGDVEKTSFDVGFFEQAVNAAVGKQDPVELLRELETLHVALNEVQALPVLVFEEVFCESQLCAICVEADKGAWFVAQRLEDPTVTAAEFEDVSRSTALRAVELEISRVAKVKLGVERGRVMGFNLRKLRVWLEIASTRSAGDLSAPRRAARLCWAEGLGGAFLLAALAALETALC